MANLVKVFGDGSGGWHLTQKQAEQLHKAGQIAKPTLTALRNYFLNEVLAPRLKEIAKKENLTTPNQLSSLRHRVPEITVAGNQIKLISLNKLMKKIQSGKEIKDSSSHLLDDYRYRASHGLDENSARLADFYDDIDVLRKERDDRLANASGADQESAINYQFDRGMEKLFKRNRRWLPKVGNRPMEYDWRKADTYGWRPGKSREEFFRFQDASYEQSQAQTRFLAKKTGRKYDAGHVVPLGGIKISESERRRFFIDKSELEQDPDGDGWILRGTNSLSNLAVELAAENRAKGNISGRELEDIIALNTAFTKSRSLLEYNLSDDKTFRQNTDYSAALRGLLGHSNIDINELISKGEDQILQTGIQIAGTLPKSQLPNQRGLVPKYKATETIGPLKTTVVNEAGNVLSQREDDLNRYSISNVLSNPNITNLLSIGPNTPKHLKGVAKFVAPLIPYGEEIIAADEVLTETFSSDPNTSRGVTKLVEKPLNYVGGATLNKPDLGTQVRNVEGVVRGIQNEDIVEIISSGSGLLHQTSFEKLKKEKDKDKNPLLFGL